MCNGAAKQVSAGVAPCNMVGFVKLFRISVTRQVSRKVEPLSTSATVAVVKKQEFQRVTAALVQLVRYLYRSQFYRHFINVDVDDEDVACERRRISGCRFSSPKRRERSDSRKYVCVRR